MVAHQLDVESGVHSGCGGHNTSPTSYTLFTNLYPRITTYQINWLLPSIEHVSIKRIGLLSFSVHNNLFEPSDHKLTVPVDNLQSRG